MAIHILVDSSSDMPREAVETYDFQLIPLSVHFGDEAYLDGIEITPHEFYEKLKSNPSHPTTSQVPPERFIEALEPILSAGDEAIIVTIGSNASGTCQSAHIAVNTLETDRVTVIDSNNLCNGVAYVAIEVAKLVQQGYGRSEIVAMIQPYLENSIEHLFCVDTLEFLKRGGRINPSKAMVAEILNIKPILNVNNAITENIHKVRGRKKIIPYYLKKIQDELDMTSDMIMVAHSQDEAFALELVEAIKNEIGWEKTIYISEIGATIGTHAGPGVLAVFYKKK